MIVNIRKLAYFLIGLFIVLIVHLFYLNLRQGPVLANHPYNRRTAAIEAKVQRGTIYDCHGVVLAKTVTQGGLKKRIYPQGEDFAPLIGFISLRYGRTGLESVYNQELLGTSRVSKLKNFINRLERRPLAGNNLILTLDANLQHLARQLLNNQRGAIVALNPKTGAILALVSAPGYDPNTIDKLVNLGTGKKITEFEILKKDPVAPFLNRATQGVYPPGSIFKIITLAGALTYAPEAVQETYNCTGSIMVEGFRLTDHAVHGEVYFQQALAVSCNAYFAHLGLALGQNKFYQNALSFGFNQNPGEGDKLWHDIYSPGKVLLPGQMSKPELASSAIGQGQITVNPLQMALAAAGIANAGVIMKPYLLSEVRSPNGGTLEKIAPERWRTATTPLAAGFVNEAMQAVVEHGTGQTATIPGLKVVGKTGSAQNPQGKTHAWFIGFAPAENPRVVVAVVVEQKGAGGVIAAPLAREILRAALTNR
ncbi:MAG: penicillin-binding transpeptidase domain-containing protein [Peptococcaceae bacterium]